MANKEVVLITGTSTGFGKLTAISLAKAGYTVYASMRGVQGSNKANAADLLDIARNEGIDIKVVEIDVTDKLSVSKAVSSILDEAGKIDVLVNNAGTLFSGITEAFSEEQIESQFATNVTGVMRMNKAVLPQMRKRGSGLLIHISSIIGRMVFPFSGLYCASKFALEALAESLRYELAPLGVDSIIVEPSAYPTPIGTKIAMAEDQQVVSEYGAAANNQMKLIQMFESILSADPAPNPQEIADAILRLIKTPSGQRPLRTVVGESFGADTINSATESVQLQALTAMSLADLAQTKVPA